MPQTSSMGKHVLVDLYECGTGLSDLASYEVFVADLLVQCRAQAISTTSHQFDGGFTHLALLTTSHCSVHTWPEWESAAIDLFTCSDEVDTDRFVDGVVDYFECLRQEARTVLR